MMNDSPTRRERSVSRGRRSFSRSRSRSPRASRKPFTNRRAFKSRSRSRGARSHSRSPMSGRRPRHTGTGNRVSPPPFHGSNRPPPRGGDSFSRSSRLMQDAPGPNKCLGVFGLSLRTNERDIREVFSRYGPIEECTVVIDAQTGRSRGFAFIYYESMEDAKAAKDSCNGIEIDNRRIRVDFSLTQRAHTPTPGIYMGNPTYGNSSSSSSYKNYDRGGGGGGGGGMRRRGGGGGRDDYRGSRRSPSPYRHRRRYSRSRSFSPRGRY